MYFDIQISPKIFFAPNTGLNKWIASAHTHSFHEHGPSDVNQFNLHTKVRIFTFCFIFYSLFYSAKNVYRKCLDCVDRKNEKELSENINNIFCRITSAVEKKKRTEYLFIHAGKTFSKGESNADGFECVAWRLVHRYRQIRSQYWSQAIKCNVMATPANFFFVRTCRKLFCISMTERLCGVNSCENDEKATKSKVIDRYWPLAYLFVRKSFHCKFYGSRARPCNCNAKWVQLFHFNSIREYEKYSNFLISFILSSSEFLSLFLNSRMRANVGRVGHALRN